jgi:O-antigen ligase
MNSYIVRDEKINYRIFWLSSALIAFLLPLSRGLSLLFTYVLILNWMLSGDIGGKIRIFVKEPLALLFSSLFFLALVGMLYTENLDDGLFYVQNWALLLIFPLIYATSHVMKPRHIKWVLLGFVSGNFVAAVYVLVLKTRDVYRSDAEFDSFFHHTNAYESFTDPINMHPAYFSLYILLSICTLFLHFKYNSTTSNILSSLAILGIFSFSILYAASRNQILLTAIVLNVILYDSMRSHLSVLWRILGIAALNAIFLVAIYNMQYTRQRFDLLLNPKLKGEKKADDRYDRWIAAIELIKKNPVFGVGTGDNTDQLIIMYQERTLTSAIENKYNAHNEFLETTVQLGLLGGLVLMTGLFLPLVMSLKYNNYLYALFLTIFILSIVTESMLSRHKGIIFYSFFNAFLFFQYARKWSLEEKEIWSSS